MITEQQIRQSLEQVNDPHVPVSISSMGMLRDITVDNNNVHVEVCIPCMGCPGTGGLVQDIRDCLSAIPGIGTVDVELAFHLPWDRDMVTDEVKEKMRLNGIQI